MVWDQFLSSPGHPYKLDQTQVIALGKVVGILSFFWGEVQVPNVAGPFLAG